MPRGPRLHPMWNLDAEFAVDLAARGELQTVLDLVGQFSLWVDPRVARAVPVVFPLIDHPRCLPPPPPGFSPGGAGLSPVFGGVLLTPAPPRHPPIKVPTDRRISRHVGRAPLPLTRRDFAPSSVASSAFGSAVLC